MASSAKKQSDNNSDPPAEDSSMVDSSHNRSNRLFTYQFFTDAVKEQKRHNFEFKGKFLLKILREQFPKCLGLKIRIIGKNKKKASELGFSIENLCRDALLKEFKVNRKVIEVKKTTFNHTANVINIGISEKIPLMEKDELKPALIKAFQR
ncbi:hypothetical protein PS6_011523 [Mucor atramentarius]